jgi:hypothetical protein
MRVSWQVVICVALTIAVSCPQQRNMADINDDMSEKLIACLQGFARENSLTRAQLETLLGDVVLNGVKIRKGGIGVIDRSTFIVLDDTRNAILVARKRWQGRKAGESEAVLLDGRHVLGPGDRVDRSTLKLVIFTPTEVHYVNLSNNSGGRYQRSIKETLIKKLLCRG